MHELGLAEDILRKILNPSRSDRDEIRNKSLPDWQAGKIQKIKVKVGEALAVTKEELQEAFNIVSIGSRAEGASLEIEMVPLKAQCSDCRKDFNPKILRLDCPYCGSINIQISSGKEFLIEDLK